MKSDERHESQRNDLGTGTADLPNLWQRYGNKVLIVVAIALLAFAAVRYQRGQAAVRQNQTVSALASAWSSVEQVPRTGRGPASAEMDKVRAGLESDINQNVQIVVDDTAATPTQSAWAWLARGELYWTLAHASTDSFVSTPATAPASAPATQPTAKTPADYLKLAENAYRKVANDYASVGVPTKVARFSLAALAEEQRDLAIARAQYKALIETADLPVTDKSMAEARLAKLDALDKPILLLPATQPVGPSGNDDLMRSLMGPQPPAAPATAPAAAPTTTPLP